MTINFGGAVYAWNSAQEIVLWVMTGVICVGFLLVQYFHPLVTKEQVLFPGHLLKHPLMLNLTVQMFLSSGVLQGAIYYIPLFFEFAKVCYRPVSLLVYVDFNSRILVRCSPRSRRATSTLRFYACRWLLDQRRSYGPIWILHALVLWRRCAGSNQLRIDVYVLKSMAYLYVAQR